ncbi:MAG TPA: hypothetical protein VHV47_08875, partial [Opitutaceae bacterium]|nr:hypothetical protein [Opitutaceae bacterium]
IASQGPNFLIRGRTLNPPGPAADILGKFRQDLSAEPAAWIWTETPPAAGAEFFWRGRFHTEAPVAAQTPEEGSARLAQALGQLPSREQAEASITFLVRDWTGGPEDVPEGGGHRSYRFSLANRRLSAWSDIVATVQTLAAEPGITIEGLNLEAGDAGSDSFAEARLLIAASESSL